MTISIEETLNRIEFELLGIEENDLTKAEINIVKHIKDYEQGE